MNWTSSTWPVWTASSSCSSNSSGWSVPVTITYDGPYVIAELNNSRYGIFGVGCTLADALSDLRAAIREFACVLGVQPCPDHKEAP